MIHDGGKEDGRYSISHNLWKINNGKWFEGYDSPEAVELREVHPAKEPAQGAEP